MPSFFVRRVLVLFIVSALTGAFSRGQQAKAPALDPAQKQAVIDEIALQLKRSYIFPDVAIKMEEALRGQLTTGALGKLSDAREFASTVSRLLLDVSHDKHIRFAYNPAAADDIRRLAGQSQEEKQRVRERQLKENQLDNFGFRRAEQLPGNVGYLDFRSFEPPDQGGATAIAAMNFLAYCDAIIVDLRQNGGGEPAQIQLISSYFFPEPVHLNDLYYRAADRMENYWTLPYVPGAKPVAADLYILTSAFTFSGAEEFTYNMKNLKRAMVIGETTGGGAHPTIEVIVANEFVLRIPYGRAINPFSKTNWEGTGITPDIAVPAAEAYDRAYALAVERLAAKATDPQRRAAYEWITTGLKAKASPPRLETKKLKSYVGVYGERKVTFESGNLQYQRTGPKYRMIPLTQTLFALDGLENFRVEFVVKAGKSVELVGHYSNGQRNSSPKSR